MERKTYNVFIPYGEHEEFELFLSEQLEYPYHGYVRYSTTDYGLTRSSLFQVYNLELLEEDVLLLRLKYKEIGFEKFNSPDLFGAFPWYF